MTRLARAAVLLVLVLGQPSLAQQSCPAIQVSAPDASQLLFNPPQEMYLGEVIADQMQSQFLVVDEDQVTMNGERLCLSNERGQLHLYDLNTLRQVDEFAFGSRITMKSFSADGQKLLVLTDDQNVTLLDLSKTLDSKTAAAKDH